MVYGISDLELTICMLDLFFCFILAALIRMFPIEINCFTPFNLEVEEYCALGMLFG